MSLIACLCEGHSERAIMDLLLDNNCLVFSREDLLEEEVLKCRSAKEFQSRYLDKTFGRKVTVYRILDSENEKFNITGPYQEKVDTVINVITSPEIEMLIIHAEGYFDDYSRKKTSRNLKPSEYVAQDLRMSNMKSYKTVCHYFSDIEKLKRAIKEYHSKAKNKENSIYELLLKQD